MISCRIGNNHSQNFFKFSSLNQWISIQNLVRRHVFWNFPPDKFEFSRRRIWQLLIYEKTKSRKNYQKVPKVYINRQWSQRSQSNLATMTWVRAREPQQILLLFRLLGPPFLVPGWAPHAEVKGHEFSSVGNMEAKIVEYLQHPLNYRNKKHKR